VEAFSEEDNIFHFKANLSVLAANQTTPVPNQLLTSEM
jgi:hypothetical protein